MHDTPETKLPVYLTIEEMQDILESRTIDLALARNTVKELEDKLEEKANRNVEYLSQINNLNKKIEDLNEDLKNKPSETNLENLIWNKIGFIKWCRERNPAMGLKEAKDFVELFWEKYTNKREIKKDSEMYKLVLKAGNITREIQRDVLFNENNARTHKIKETIIHISLENAVHHAKVVAESWGGSSHGSVLVKEAGGNEKIVSQINF